MDQDQVVRFVRDDFARVTAGLALLCGDRALAEDAVQDALAQGLHRSEVTHDVRAWVSAVALNRIRAHHRRRSAEGRALLRLASRRVPDPTGEPDVSDEALAAALATLPDRQREAVVLHHLLDLSVERTAALCGVSEGTIKTSLHRARQALRRTLAPGPGAQTEEAGDVA